MSQKEITLIGGPPWGFRISKYNSSTHSSKVVRVNPSSKASSSGLREGDLILNINGNETDFNSILNDSSNGQLDILILRSFSHSLDQSVSSPPPGQQISQSQTGSVSEAEPTGPPREQIEKEIIDSLKPLPNLQSSPLKETEEVTLLDEIISELQEDSQQEKVGVAQSPSGPPVGLGEIQKSEEEIPIVWTPPSLEPSPKGQRKFRPILFKADENKGDIHSPLINQGPQSQHQSGGLLLVDCRDVNNQGQSHLLTIRQSEEKVLSSQVQLPKYTSPTVTLLKKAREGQLPKGARYLPQDRVDRVDRVEISQVQPVQARNIEAKTQQQKKSSVGTGSSSSIPVELLKSKEVLPEEQQHEWYRRMYEQIHVEKGKGKPLQSSSHQKPEDKSSSIGIRFNPGKIEDYNPEKSGQKRRVAVPKHWALAEDPSPPKGDYKISKSPEPRPLTPSEQRSMYLEIQKGGDVPFKGLRMGASPSPTPDPDQSTPTTPSPSKLSLIKTRLLTRSASEVRSKSFIPRYRTLTSPDRVRSATQTIQVKFDDGNKSEAITLRKEKKVKSKIKGPPPLKPPRKKSERNGTNKETNEKKSKPGSQPKGTLPVIKIPLQPLTPTLISPEVKQTKTSLLREIINSPLGIVPKPGKIRRSLSQQTLKDYTHYIINLRNSTMKSDRFKRLHSLYSSLERLNSLSKSTEIYNITKLPESKTYDFQEWWKYRNRSRIDKEMDELTEKLLRAQSNREFFFKPNFERKWVPSSDNHLRFKKFNVNELRDNLFRAKELKVEKDVWRIGYRGCSVRESALSIEIGQEVNSKSSNMNDKSNVGIKRCHSICSSLSDKQREFIKDRLKWQLDKLNSRDLNKSSSGLGLGLGDLKRVVLTPMGFTLSSDPYRVSSLDNSSFRLDYIYDDGRKRMSSQICSEFKLGKVKLRRVDFVGNTYGRSEIKGRPAYSIYNKECVKDKVRVFERNKDCPDCLKRSRSVSPTLPLQTLQIETKQRERVIPIIVKSRSFSSLKEGSSGSVIRGIKKMNSEDNLKEHKLSTRCRRPLYQPSSSPNVCQPVLVRGASPSGYSDYSGDYESSTWRRSLLDERVFRNFDPTLHQPKFRYVPISNGGRGYTSLEQQAHSSTPTQQLHPQQITTMVNIHYPTPVTLEQKDYIEEDELRRKQEIAMKKFYEEQRRIKYFKEVEDLERRRHTDFFVPSQKSPIPLNRYESDDDEDYDFYGRNPSPAPPEEDMNRVFKAKALYDFRAVTNRELSFCKGDVLTILRKLDSNWYEGEFGRKIGIFPCNYVSPLPSSTPQQKRPITPTGQTTQALVLYDFTPTQNTEVELHLVKGEVVKIIRKVDENWFEGRIGWKKGIFPCSYVKVIDKKIDLSKHSYTPDSFRFGSGGFDLGTRDEFNPNKGIRYKTVYAYRPTHNDELELQENDQIHVLEKCDDGWFVGTNLRSGAFGTFPGNYVESVG